MRRILPIIFVFAVLLALPVRAAQKAVALTFDDGPNGAVTRQLLDVLEARDVKATFFLCGCNLEKDPETARKIALAGHEIGLHGYSHQNLGRMSAAQVQVELDKSQRLIRDLFGAPSHLLRPPGGSVGNPLVVLSAEEELSLILWSVDPADWRPEAKASDITRQVLEQVQPGSIILMHDLGLESVDAAGAIIDKLRDEGYVFCTVSELAGFYGTRLQPGEQYYKFAFYEE